MSKENYIRGMCHIINIYTTKKKKSISQLKMHKEEISIFSSSILSNKYINHSTSPFWIMKMWSICTQYSTVYENPRGSKNIYISYHIHNLLYCIHKPKCVYLRNVHKIYKIHFEIYHIQSLPILTEFMITLSLNIFKLYRCLMYFLH